MARQAYVGVKNKAKKVRYMYIGVDDKARKIVKAYVGVNNVARIFYTADWWVPYGLQESDCIAAWQFYHANSQDAANRDISGHGYNIWDSRYCSWNQASGYYVTSGYNASGLKPVNSFSPVVGVFWYTGLPYPGTGSLDGGRWFRAAGNSTDMAGRIGIINCYVNGAWVNRDNIKNYPAFGITYDPRNNYKISGFRGNSILPDSGVVAFDRYYPEIYVNGNAIGVTAFSFTTENTNNVPIATGSYLASIGGGTAPNMYIRAAAFFNTKLSPAQHADIAKRIKEIK